MTKLDGWGERLERCLLLYQARHGRTSLERWGELIAAAEGREKPYVKGALLAWFKERAQPRLSVFEAVARLSGCDPWWIVWEVGRPPLNPSLEHFTPVEDTRGAKVVAPKKRRLADFQVRHRVRPLQLIPQRLRCRDPVGPVRQRDRGPERPALARDGDQHEFTVRPQPGGQMDTT